MSQLYNISTWSKIKLRKDKLQFRFIRGPWTTKTLLNNAKFSRSYSYSVPMRPPNLIRHQNWKHKRRWRTAPSNIRYSSFKQCPRKSQCQHFNKLSPLKCSPTPRKESWAWPLFMYTTIQSLNLIKHKTESKTKSGTTFFHLSDRPEARAYGQSELIYWPLTTLWLRWLC